MNLKPRHNYVILEDIKPEEETTKGGVIVPIAGSDVFRQPMGIICAVGPEVTGLLTGMKVLYSGNAGWKHNYLGKLYILVSDREILGIIP